MLLYLLAFCCTGLPPSLSLSYSFIHVLLFAFPSFLCFLSYTTWMVSFQVALHGSAFIAPIISSVSTCKARCYLLVLVFFWVFPKSFLLQMFIETSYARVRKVCRLTDFIW